MSTIRASTIRATLDKLAARLLPIPLGLPAAEFTAVPASPQDLAELLVEASASRLRVLIWGGGSHQGFGYRVRPDLVISTAGLNQITAWVPDDMTVVAEAGVPVARLEETLGTRQQTAVLPETPGQATLGGTLAAGVSGYRRARYGPTRDRILEVTVVTGDGRIVRAGGRVVKNVTGFDLPRLVVGSLGSLGVIVSACLKLWPSPAVTASVTLDDPAGAGLVFRPLAVLATPGATRVFLGGTAAEVHDQLARLDGTVTDQLDWPPPVGGALTWSVRVPPDQGAEAIPRLPSGAAFIHQVTIGEIAVGTTGLEGMADVRSWCESVGGSLVLASAPEAVYESFDPWGGPPAALDLQRRLVAGFDPARVLNPGRLPGGI